MQHAEFEPPVALRDAVKCIWYDRRDLGAAPSSFEVMPDGYVEIIFYFGGPCSISCDGVVQAVPSPFMMGLLNRPVVLQTQGRFEVVGIRCYPWTVFDLLGLSPGKGGPCMFQHPLAQLQSTVAELIAVDRIDQALAHVTLYFLEARSQVTMDTMLFKAGVAMRAANGTMPVSKVAAAAHATVRTLERKFRQSSGHTVKDVSGLMRFEQARNLLWTKPDCNLAAMAHQLGYTDQSHLSREFKRYSGTTPAAFARKASSAKTSTSNEIVAFVQV